ncbi:rhomboid family intramembrane serine protease [Rhodobacteraceae bacterium KMM 6894]|nr:rhomboid family intramembrane serine protease [Rhodobacteraceae bacterium KMM 6894]
MSHPDDVSPINPLPPVVVVLFLAVVIPEIAFFLGAKGLIGGSQAIGWRTAAIQDYAFNGDILRWMIDGNIYPSEHLMRFITYPFVHGSFSETLFSAALLLALGKFVGEIFRPWATLVVFVAASVLGAVVYGLTVRDTPWLYGAFPGSYGLIGAFTYLVWLQLGAKGGNQMRAFAMIGFLMGAQLLFGLLFGSQNKWVADLTGFVTGFGLSFFVSPGGWAKIRTRLQQR